MQAAPPDVSVADSLGADSLVTAPPNMTEAASGLWAKLVGWYEGFIELLPNLFVAVVIVVAAAFLARLARRVVTALLHRVTEHAPQARNVVDLLGTLAYVAVLAVGTFLALRVIGLDGIVTTLLAGAGIVGLALGFAFQDIAANFIAGILMAIRNPFVVGEIIESNDYMGTVKEISLRSTVIDTFQGQKVIIPNSKVFGDPIVNYSARRSRRVDLTCGVGYGDDLQHAEDVAVAAVKGLVAVQSDRPVQLYYNEFGDSSINFVLRFWVAFSKQTDFLEAQSEAIKAVKAAFDREGVTIPFPIRTLDFDPNGGVDLRAALKGSGGAPADGDGAYDDGAYDG